MKLGKPVHYDLLLIKHNLIIGTHFNKLRTALLITIFCAEIVTGWFVLLPTMKSVRTSALEAGLASNHFNQ
jgi:hypothetical protein